MTVNESRSRLANSDLFMMASRVALAPTVNREFFEVMGATAYEAILRENLGALDMVFGGIEMKFSNPLLLADKNTRLRLQGNRVIVAGGIATLRRLQAGESNWPDRETNRASLTQAVDDLLAGQQEGRITTIARVIPDTIQSFEPEYLQFGCDQLERLRSSDAPVELQMLAIGMMDVVRPALARVTRQ